MGKRDVRFKVCNCYTKNTMRKTSAIHRLFQGKFKDTCSLGAESQWGPGAEFLAGVRRD